EKPFPVPKLYVSKGFSCLPSISLFIALTCAIGHSIRVGLRQVKRPSSNPKSERYFWLYPDFIEGNFKYKKWRTNPCESILRFSDPSLQ
ncbi:hypothetical protein N9D29_07265, partial [Flavobacteriaceae bacterium]|nr:hypothetical protein [Flavobacteriaceae bacterium]